MTEPASTLADKIETFIHDRNYVSFAELARHWPEHFNNKEESLCMELGDYNIMLWAWMSRVGVDALEKLRVQKRVDINPADTLVYIIDGGPIPNYPVVKQKRKYKTPRWLPVTFSIPGSPQPS